MSSARWRIIPRRVDVGAWVQTNICTNNSMEENVQKSQDRILVTHAGSLPRGEPLGSMLIDQEAGKPVEAAALKKAIEARVTHVLNKQVEVGIDEVNDGEQGRIGFQTYVAQRMSGFGGVSDRPYGKDWQTFPQFSDDFSTPPAAHRQGQRCSPGHRRHPIPGRGVHRRRDRAANAIGGADQIARCRHFYERGVTRHHRNDNAQRLLQDI